MSVRSIAGTFKFRKEVSMAQIRAHMMDFRVSRPGDFDDLHARKSGDDYTYIGFNLKLAVGEKKDVAIRKLISIIGDKVGYNLNKPDVPSGVHSWSINDVLATA